MNLVVFQEECERLKDVYKLINSHTPRNRNIKITIISFQTTIFIVAQHDSLHISSPASDPMNLSANRVKRNSFTAAEKQDKRDREKCLYYEKTSYFADNCPHRFIIRSVSISSNLTPSSQSARIETFQPAQKVQENV